MNEMAQSVENALPYPLQPPKSYEGLYPSLNDYMGLELTPELYAQFAVAVPQPVSCRLLLLLKKLRILLLCIMLIISI